MFHINTTMPVANALRVTTWSEVAEEVRQANPTLAALIDAIQPDDRFPLIEVTLGFGEKLFEDDQLRLPARNGKMKPLSDEDLTRVEPLLNYSLRPLGLQLKRNNESFLEFEDRIIPLDIIHEGDFICLAENTGLTHTLVHPLPWSMTSGSRSAFMVPKITDTRSHNRLKAEFMFHRGPPTGLADHWHVFRAIASSAFDEFDWTSKTLFFSKAWLHDRPDTPEWKAFQLYLLESSLHHASRRQPMIECTTVWEDFCSAIRQKNLKPGPYLLDTVKHLVRMGLGDGIGYMPEDGRERAIPSKLLELAYSETYQSEYAPILMVPSRLSRNPVGRTLYYSMGMPSMLEGTPSIRKAPSVITELREIKTIMRLFQGLLKVEQYASMPLLKHLKLEYYHSEIDPFGEIVNSADIAEHDDILKERLATSRIMRKEFPTHGQFLRGCISLQVRTPPEDNSKSSSEDNKK